MAEASKIARTHATFNPWIGCTKVSPGCARCYAAEMANARPALVLGAGVARVQDGVKLPVWGAEAPRRVTGAAYWRQPLRWNKQAQAAGERRRVFCASLADVFEDRSPRVGSGLTDDLEEPRQRLWGLIRDTPYLDWLLLTKRPQNVLLMVPEHWRPHEPGRGPTAAWPRNVWIGTTVEDQHHAYERLPHLLRIPAPVRFVSYEPALEAVDFGPWMPRRGPQPVVHLGPFGSMVLRQDGIDWLIVGGESGPGARPFDLAWARAVRDQCAAAQVPFFFKQAGARPYDSTLAWKMLNQHEPANEKHARDLASFSLRDRKGGDMDEWPADLKVRQFPEVTHG